LLNGIVLLTELNEIAIQSATILLNLNGYEDVLDEIEVYNKTMEITESQIPDNLYITQFNLLPESHRLTPACKGRG